MDNSFDKAIETFQKVLRLNPAHRETHRDLGIIYWQQGEPEKALASLRRAFDLGIRSAELYCYLGLACEGAGLPDLAAEHFKAALAQNPGAKLLTLAYSRLGRLQFQEGALEAALESLHKANRLNPLDAQTCLHLALAYDEQDRLEEAVRWFNKALMLTPPPEAAAEVHARLGLACLALGLVEEAYELARKAISLDAGTTLAHGLLGTIFLANGLYTQAAAHLAEQERLSPGDASCLHHLGLAQRREAQAEQENISCQMKLGTNPGNPELLAALGATCIALGRHDEAVRTLEKVVDLDINNARAHYQLARAFSARGAGAPALVCFQRYRDFNQNISAGDLLNLGCMQARQGAGEETIASFERAIDLAGESGRLEPWNGPSCALLARAFGNKKLYARAIALYKEALVFEPDNPRIWLALAADHLKHGDYRESLEGYRAAYRLTAGRDRTSLTLAECQLARGEADQAVQTCLERLRTGEKCYKTYLTLGRAYLAKGLLQEAVASCQHVLALTPEQAEAHSCLGGSYFGRRSCYEGDSLLAMAYACLGNAFVGLARWDDAVASFKKAVDYDTRDAKSWYQLGEAYAAKGMAHEATECLRRAEELSPLEAKGNRKYGVSAASGDELDSLILDLKKTLETTRENFEAYKGLGAAYGRKGQHDDAIYYLKKALKLRPADSELLLNLGLAHEAKGEDGAAFALYDRAADLQPENPAVCTAAAQRFLEKRAYDKVLQCYSRLAGKALESPVVQTHLARAHQARGEYAAAIANYKWLAVEGKEESGKAYRELALCALALNKHDDMLQYAHEALLRDPADAELHRRLADYHFDQGEHDKALPHYQALLDLAPADSRVLSRLASVYLQKANTKPEDRK
ncbi:MAG: tetratricopeptide repeat protein [Elusimicrobiota bacterium]|nr:tetratricopeptide repeat protein [Elusimicrobiota bacterium]